MQVPAHSTVMDNLHHQTEGRLRAKTELRERTNLRADIQQPVATKQYVAIATPLKTGVSDIGIEIVISRT